jgi:hypothetical protein
MKNIFSVRQQWTTASVILGGVMAAAVAFIGALGSSMHKSIEMVIGFYGKDLEGPRKAKQFEKSEKNKAKKMREKQK